MFQSLQQEIHKNRIYGLDVLRCAAILMVLVEHGMLLLSPIFEYLDFMKLGGYWGVELFFVLSGFLIAGILLRVYEKETVFGGKVLWSFWKRRWFRTLPMYYLILLLNIAFFYRAGGKLGLTEIEYFLFLQNFWKIQANFFAESWTLAVEEWFYIAFPLVLLLASKLLFIKTKKNQFLVAILFLLFFAVGMRVLEVWTTDPYWDGAVRKVVVFRLDAILTGVLFAWWQHYYATTFYQYRRVFLLFCIILLGASFYGYYWDILADGISTTSFWGKTFYFNLTSFAFACSLPYAAAVKRVQLSKTARLITTISIVSYSMYLLHLSIVLRLLHQFSFWNTSVGTALVLYGIYFLLTVLISIVFYSFFEKPMMDLRERF